MVPKVRVIGPFVTASQDTEQLPPQEQLSGCTDDKPDEVTGGGEEGSAEGNGEGSGGEEEEKKLSRKELKKMKKKVR